MRQIDLDDSAQRNGAVYFVVGRGTEGGTSPFKLGVAANKWGDPTSVIDNSGYSIGTIQVDLGQRGTWPLGSAVERAPNPGETTYVDAIIRNASVYANENKLPFPEDAAGLAALRSDLLSHGNGLNGRTTIRFISDEYRRTFNAWAGSDEGKQWIHKNIDFPQVKALADSSKQVLDQYGAGIPEDKRFEVLCILAKSANQHTKTYNALVESLKGGSDYKDFMDLVEARTQKYQYYDGDKAGELARQYQENFQKPGNAAAMEEAHRKVASESYRPSDERGMPEVQTALAAYRRDVNDPSVLDRGDKGDEVRALQQALQRAGKSLKDDGGFGAGTERLLTDFQREHRLDPTGFGDRATLKALGLAPTLDPRTGASLHRMIETLQAGGRFSEAQIARIAESSQNYLLEHRAALGEVTHIQLRNDGQKILFQNDFKQMRELDTQQALQGYVPARPLVEAPSTTPAQTQERTADAAQR